MLCKAGSVSGNGSAQTRARCWPLRVLSSSSPLSQGEQIGVAPLSTNGHISCCIATGATCSTSKRPCTGRGL
eukprot:5474847-Karenia_brevis.AAC.1